MNRPHPGRSGRRVAQRRWLWCRGSRVRCRRPGDGYLDLYACGRHRFGERAGGLLDARQRSNRQATGGPDPHPGWRLVSGSGGICRLLRETLSRMSSAAKSVGTACGGRLLSRRLFPEEWPPRQRSARDYRPSSFQTRRARSGHCRIRRGRTCWSSTVGTGDHTAMGSWSALPGRSRPFATPASEFTASRSTHRSRTGP